MKYSSIFYEMAYIFWYGMVSYEMHHQVSHHPLLQIADDLDVTARILCVLQVTYKINFGQIYLSKPMMTEADGETATLWPKAARLRNLTYSAPLYVDVTKFVTRKNEDGEEETEQEDLSKVYIGKVFALHPLGFSIEFWSCCQSCGTSCMSWNILQ